MPKLSGMTPAEGKERTERYGADGIEVEPLRPVLGDFNDDLRLNGREALRLALLPQLVAADARFAVDP